MPDASKQLNFCMRPTLLNVSHRAELRLHAEVAASLKSAATQAGAELLLVGAFARDLHLHYVHGIDIQRGTEDVDFAIAVRDWDTFDAIRAQLITQQQFLDVTGKPHRFRHANGLPIDLVPFGGTETRERTVVWPPHGDMVMNAFGFQEALETAETVTLPENVVVPVVSLAAFGLLKFIAWEDRHMRSPRKDATDLTLLIRNYLRAGNEARLWDEFSAWADEDGFDVDRASARLLGHDIRLLLRQGDSQQLIGILSRQCSEENAGRLPREMIPHDAEFARSILLSLWQGFQEAG